jgi:tripartite-type tricarboxylate transporter receptor subunit TctC
MQGSLIKTVLLFAALLMATPALATYPEHPINLVVEFAPGGSADIVARLMAQALNSELGQTVIVENKPGAGGNIGGTFVAHAAPDGYTVLLAAAGPIVINPSLYKSMAYSPIKDLAPVTMIEREHNLMVVNNSIPANNLTEFIAYAKAHPGEINFGSPGDGSPAHLAGELLNQKAGLKMQHVPYKGTSPALSDLIGGHITLMIDNMPALLPAVKSGTLRAIAVPSEHRAAAAPDIPTFAEEGMPGFVITAWKGLMVPAGTPQPVGNTPAQFAVQIKDETEFYSKLVKSTGASID